MTTIIVVGAGGQLGRALLAPLGELRDAATGKPANVIAVRRDAEDPACAVDLTDPPETASRIAALAPDVIVNAAAYTAVDAAEDAPALAYAVNAEGPATLADVARRMGALLVHFSTDYVFDGSGTRPWREQDQPAPLGVYGRSKYAGEQAVSASGCDHWIIRTSWVYGPGTGNFLDTMLRLGAERSALQVVEDEIGAPTHVALLSSALRHMLAQRLAHGTGPAGIYHLTASGETSWHGFARAIFSEARQRRIQPSIDPDDIAPIASVDYLTRAERPLNSRLDTARVRSEFGLELRAWQADVAEEISRRAQIASERTSTDGDD